MATCSHDITNHLSDLFFVQINLFQKIIIISNNKTSVKVFQPQKSACIAHYISVLPSVSSSSKLVFNCQDQKQIYDNYDTVEPLSSSHPQGSGYSGRLRGVWLFNRGTKQWKNPHREL